MRLRKTLTAAALSLATVAAAGIGGMTAYAVPAQTDADATSTVADWKFQQSNATGTIDGKDLVIKDDSGNGNDLHMQVYGNDDYKLSDYISWSDLAMDGDPAGSIKLNGDSDLANKKNTNRDPKGADFITADDAPINKEQFANGYTLEFIYYLPDDFNAGTDQWMGIAARQSVNNNMDEHEMGSMSLAISNCKETQFKAADKDNRSTMNTDDPNNGVTSWGVTMDHGGVWYHIAVVSDGANVTTYVNGAKAFRNINKNGDGLYADPTDGRFRIGSAYYNDTFDTSKIEKNDLDKFLRGNLEEVRFSRGAVAQANWLIPNPTDYIKDYGTDDKFSNANPSVHNMVFIPDTQNTIRWMPDVMDTAIDEFNAQKSAQHVTNVVSLGDIVDNWDSDEQWQDSAEVFSRLQSADVPFLEQPGNHDYNAWGDTAHSYGGPGQRKADNYLTYFGPDSDFGREQAADGFQYSPDGMSSYVTVDNGSYKYLVVNIDMGAVTGNDSATSNDDMRWFEQVLKDHPNNPTVVVSHDIFKCSDSNPNEISLDDDSGYNGTSGDREGAGSKIWNIVKKYNQVFLMYGGHNHGSGQMTLTNDAGNQVLGVLADYQFAYNGGNAFFKYLGLDEAGDKLTIRTYSPYSATLSDSQRSFFDVNFLTGEGNVYEQDFDYATRFAGMEHSSQDTYALQQNVVKLVRGITSLGADSDASVIRDLYDTYNALPEATRSEFGAADDASTLAGKLAAAYAAAFPEQKPSNPPESDGRPSDGDQQGDQQNDQKQPGSDAAAAEIPARLSDTGSVVTGVMAAVAVLAAVGTIALVASRRMRR